MTAYQLSEIVGTLLGYVGTDKRAHPYDTFFCADAIRGAKIADFVKLNGDGVLGQFCLPIIFPVQFDETRKRPYIDLKTQVLGLQNNKGIIEVTLPQEEDSGFTVRAAGMNAVYANLIAGLWPTKKCWVEGTKIYFYQLEPLQTEIMVKAIPSLFYWVKAGDDTGMGVIDFESELPQPYEFNAFLIEGARQWFEEQKYYPDSKSNEGVAPRLQSPKISGNLNNQVE